LYCIFVYSKIG